MKLDVIIPTYNRGELLKRTLDSLLAAHIPQGAEVRVTVVDNNSKDDTRAVVEGYMAKFGGRLRYLFEGKQGRSHALNAGIAATNGDLVGMIDDDEEVEAHWYARVDRAFRDGNVDFVSGPYIPRWGAAQPAWLPNGYRAVIGAIDGGDQVRVFGKEYDGVLMGGNAVVTRAMLNRVGPYSTLVGRKGSRLLAGEDEDMTARLLAAGARGLYLPDLIIYHYIPPERLTKRYYRRWCFWNSVSLGVLDRERPSPVVYLIGVPRYRYGRAARAMLRIGPTLLKRDRSSSQNFSDELAIWDLAGFFYGKHFYRPDDARGVSANSPSQG
ncbi:glycosyltransferase family 2 protein [Sorangium sp. So ce375]|uniref:glycosyltransferase n=1 Tax=Sorangium sp. So ce375 TaxID=3133306 RepID=UPI003F5BC6EC